jgi:MFS family permease
MQLIPIKRPFYGWIVASCAFMVMFLTYGIQYSFGVFLPALLEEFGWTQASLAGAFSLYTLVYSGFAFLSGRLTDRWGPQKVISLGGLLLGGGLILLSQANTKWQVYLFYGLIAGLGMSTAYVPCNATVVKWFSHRRGAALGLTGSGASLGIFAIPPLATILISSYGWRVSYLLFGAAICILLNVLGRFMHRDPEALGLQLNGDSITDQDYDSVSNRSLGLNTMDLDVSRAIKTAAFWILTSSIVAALFTVTIPFVYLVSYAKSFGHTNMAAATLISGIGIAALIGNLSMGTLSDWIGRRTTFGFALFLGVCGFTGFAEAKTVLLLYPSLAAFGLYYGGITVLFPGVIGDYFGRTNAGALTGIIFALSGPAAALGPVAAGYIYDLTGYYSLAFLLSALMNFIALGTFMLAKEPKTKGG